MFVTRQRRRFPIRSPDCRASEVLEDDFVGRIGKGRGGGPGAGGRGQLERRVRGATVDGDVPLR